MTRPCGATRPALVDAGWECTGSGLVVVFVAKLEGGPVPVVLPARALEVIGPESWWDDPIVPFTGGDHVHLQVPRRPVEPFETDTTLVTGSTAGRYKSLGSLGGGSLSLADGSSIDLSGGTLYIGGPA